MREHCADLESRNLVGAPCTCPASEPELDQNGGTWEAWQEWDYLNPREPMAGHGGAPDCAIGSSSRLMNFIFISAAALGRILELASQPQRRVPVSALSPSSTVQPDALPETGSFKFLLGRVGMSHCGGDLHDGPGQC